MKTMFTQMNPIFMFAVRILVLHGLAMAALADDGGTKVLPELNGSITIEDEGSVACSDAEWPVSSDSALQIVSFTPLVGFPNAVNGNGKILIHHPADTLLSDSLYVYFEITDGTENLTSDGDNLVLMFDLSHDHAVDTTSSFSASDDRGIRFFRNNTVNTVYGTINNPQTHMAFTASRACVSNSAGQWIVEAQIQPADIGLSNFNALMGAAVLVDNRISASSNFSVWPSTATSNPTSWVNLVTRPPIDYVVLVDESGSMSGNKWDSARQAIDNLRGMLGQLHDSALTAQFNAFGLHGGGDRIGLASFSTRYASGAHVYYEGLAPLADSPLGYAGALPDSPGGGTPMVAGVNETFDMFGGPGNLNANDTVDTVNNPRVVRKKVVMMLSDGRHNSPSTVIDFNQGGSFDYVPVAMNCDSVGTPNSLVNVNTVAVGTDATVSTAYLDSIRGCFGGTNVSNHYNITGSDEPALTAELTRHYFETLYPYYHLNLINEDGSNFSLNAGERKLVLFAFWSDASGTGESLSITTPTGVQNGTCEDALGYCFLVINDPPAGNYSNYNAHNDGMVEAVRKFVVLDLLVDARFSLDNQPHGTDSTITLRTRLQDAGQPILGADVKVDVRRPSEGFGTVASTLSPQCERISPQLPDIILRNPDTVTARAPALVPTFSSPNLDIAAANNNTPDVNPPAFALMESILKACGKDALDRTQDNALPLFDDGTHGDAHPGDGIYTRLIDNSTIEGSYVFRFTAQGNTLSGSSFHRLQELGEYVRVAVDPANSASGSREIAVNGSLVTQEYYVIPQDRHGGYLGPGHTHAVSFFVAGSAVKLGEVNDYNNGIYSQFVRFDRERGRPIVVPSVQGKPIVDVGGKQRDCWPPLWAFHTLLLALVLLLLLCFWLWRIHAHHMAMHRRR